LQKFDLKEDGGLASICLTNVQRKGFANAKTSEIVNDDPFKEYFNYKEVPSSFLVIPFENILNLNVRFFKVNIKPYTPPPPVVEENKNLAVVEEKPAPKFNFDMSTGEAILLFLTFLILVVVFISVFSKPDKTAREKEEDRVSSRAALAVLALIPIAHFLFKFGWLWSILGSFGLVIGVLWAFYGISVLRQKWQNKKEKQAKK
jgi:hypothetical protein